MGFSGRLEGIAPSDIFQIISQNRMTGTLIARCPEGTAMIVFKDGQVIEATSDDPQESLGHLLVSQGLMSKQTIEAAQDRLKKEPDQPLGTILVHMGAISEKTLEAVVFRQIGHIVHRLMSCDDGFITFDRGELALKRKLNTREFFLATGVSAEYLIMERARVVDEERRSGSDRRALPRSVSAGAGSAVAAASAAQEGGMPGAIRTIKRIARSAGERLNAVMPWLNTAWNKVSVFSPDGRAMVFTGIVGIAAGVVLILVTTLSFQTPGSELVVTGKVVNIRSKPTPDAKVIAKMSKGETISVITFKEGWHQVRTKTGDTGWIWKSLVEQKAKKGLGVTYKYNMKGFELVLIAGIALLVEGIRRKRSAGSP